MDTYHNVDNETALEIARRHNETRVIIAAIFAITVMVLAVIAAFYLDELNDHDTEKACVQNTSDTDRSCDV